MNTVLEIRVLIGKPEKSDIKMLEYSLTFAYINFMGLQRKYSNNRNFTCRIDFNADISISLLTVVH
jgi:hypothetical protein